MYPGQQGGPQPQQQSISAELPGTEEGEQVLEDLSLLTSKSMHVDPSSPNKLVLF